MVSCNEPTLLYDEINVALQCLIYIQSRLKRQGSPELALDIRKKERVTITWLFQTCIIVLMSVLGLDRKFAGDYD